MSSTISHAELALAPNGPLSPALRVLLELGDDRLILGHRLSEWCGHGPMLEEDIALTNIALDLIGHATSAYGFVAAKITSDANREVSPDTLAYLRDEQCFYNVPLTEQENGDFAQTIARQFLFDAYQIPLLEALAQQNLHDSADVAAWAAKSLKEDRYHLRHSSQWMIRLGDGTEESKARVTEALEFLWRHTAELTEFSPALRTLFKDTSGSLERSIGEQWRSTVSSVLTQATLAMPADSAREAALKLKARGRAGQHSEFLGPLLAEMQVLPRAYPSATW